MIVKLLGEAPDRGFPGLGSRVVAVRDVWTGPRGIDRRWLESALVETWQQTVSGMPGFLGYRFA